MKRGLIACSVAVLVMTTAGAFAHTARYDTEVRIKKVGQVTMKRGTNAFRGVVRSERGSCEQDREVQLIYDDGTPPNTVQGTDTTNENGRFYIEIQVFPPGKYFVRATREEHGSGGHSHVCKPDKSKAYIREL